MSQKLNGGGQELASQVPALHVNMCKLGRKTAFFLHKPAYDLLKMAK